MKIIKMELIVKTNVDADGVDVAWELTDWFMDAIEQHQEDREDCCDWELIDIKPLIEEGNT